MITGFKNRYFNPKKRLFNYIIKIINNIYLTNLTTLYLQDTHERT